MTAHRFLHGWRAWCFATLLYLPVVCFYLAHYHPRDAELVPTGFAQYDQPYYMANAREYADGNNHGLLYALPFSADPEARAIHFQPQFAVLGWLWALTGMDPGLLFVLFGAVFGLLCIRVCLKVLDHALPAGSRNAPWYALLFLWGGGILFLVGSVYGLLHGETFQLALARAFRFDPANGWWFLNLGRNLIFPLEAYYHFLFFGLVLMVLRKRYALVLVLAALLAISHPFTGIGALLMLLLWSVLECWYVRSSLLPKWFMPAAGLLVLIALMYYGVVLPRDAEHASLMAQWKLPWTEEAIHFVPAYLLVGLAALGALRSPSRFLAFAKTPFHRLLLVWAITWFALENHEFAIEPVQPVHFSRGYTWSALFLIGIPFLATAVVRLRDRFGRAVPTIVLCSASLLLLLDNSAWFTIHIAENRNASGEGVTLTSDQRDVYNWINSVPGDKPLLIANDPMVAYLALVYTPCRAYYSHNYNTPFADQRYRSLLAYFEGNITDPLLKQELLVIAYEGVRPFVFADRGERLYSNASYGVYRMPPVP